MDAGRVKEIVFKTIEKEAGSNQWAEYHFCARLRREIDFTLADADAAEQESYKDLPLCNEERGKLVARMIDPCTWYNPLFCVYYRPLNKPDGEGWKDISRCACLTEEPAEIKDLWPDDLLNPVFDEGRLEKCLCDLLSYDGDELRWKQKVFEMCKEIKRQMVTLHGARHEKS